MILDRIWVAIPPYGGVHFQMVYPVSDYPLAISPLLFAIVQSLCHLGLSCDPIDGSLPGSSVHEIFQSRILKQVAISSHTILGWKLSPAAPPAGYPGFTGVLSYSCLGCHHHFPDEKMQVGGLMTLCLVQQPVQGRYGMETISPRLFLPFHDDKGLLPRLF